MVVDEVCVQSIILPHARMKMCNAQDTSSPLLVTSPVVEVMETLHHFG